jgi:NAD+ kinase
MKLGIVANYTHDRSSDIVKTIVSWARGQDVELVFAPDIIEEEGIGGNTLDDVDIDSLRALLVIGGDGTILTTAQMVSGSSTPLLGINVGGLGFLTIATSDNYRDVLDRFVRGDFVVQERMLLQVTAEAGDGRETGSFLALNDAVIYKGAFSRIVGLRIEVGGEEAGTILADGIIVSTPTGSTGYSLSAGGPVVVPEMEVILVTPICPHTLGARPLVIPADRPVTVEVLSPDIEITLTIDGQMGTILGRGSLIRISEAPETVRLVVSSEDSFFTLLRQKLGWIVREG